MGGEIGHLEFDWMHLTWPKKKSLGACPNSKRRMYLYFWVILFHCWHIWYLSLLFAFYRENGSSGGADGMNVDESNLKANGNHKRKQSDVVSETQNPNKSPKRVQGNQQSSPNNTKGSFKTPKGHRLDWSVLRPSKSQNKNKRGWVSSMFLFTAVPISSWFALMSQNLNL